MPLIRSINNLRNTTEISNISHKELARMNRIDQAIFESEQEMEKGAEAVEAEKVFAELGKKHFG